MPTTKIKGQNTQGNTPKKQLTPAMEANKWRPGQSGNPGGRPKRKPITDALDEVLAETNPRTKKLKALEVAESLFKQAKKGNVKAIALLLDRIEGKVTQDVNVEGEIGGRITVEIVDVAGS